MSKIFDKSRARGGLDEIVTVHSAEYTPEESISKLGGEDHLALQEGHQLRRDLKPRVISMISIGGALGTGLLIAVTTALANAGPASVLISYSIVGAMVYFVMCALGEMASFIPLPEGFAGYAKRYCDPALGFAVGIAYLCKYLIVAPNQLVAGALVMQYWVSADRVNPGVWVAIILAVVLFINYFGVKFFGEFEFWLSSLKVITMIGLIILLFVIMLGGGPTHDRIGFRYWSNPGAFAPYEGVQPTGLAKFVAFFSVMVTAVFAYLGTELVGVTFGEAKNARYSIKKAIKLTLIRIIFFYVCSVLLLGCCVAYNDPSLIAAKKAKVSTAAASAFVVAINNAKIKGLPQLLNACILLFIFSATNSDVYTATRNVYALSASGMFPSFFSKTNERGVPIYALIFAGMFCLLAFMVCSSSSQKIFNYFVNVVSIFGLLTWISILVTYLYFLRAVKAQGYDRKKDFVYTAPFQPWGTYITLGACCFVALIKNFTVFIGDFDYKTFITGYIGIPVFLFALFGYKIFYKTKTVNPYEADLITYKAQADEDQEEYENKLAEKVARRKELGKGKDMEWWYDHTLGWFF